MEEIWEDVDKVMTGIETSQYFTFVTRSRVLRTVVAARPINFPEHLLRVKSHVGLDALCHLLSLAMFIIRRQLKARSEGDTVLKESSHFSKVSKLLNINTLGEKSPHMWRMFANVVFDKGVLSKLYKGFFNVAI